MTDVKSNTLLLLDQNYFESDEEEQQTEEEKDNSKPFAYPYYFGSYPMKIFVFHETQEVYWYLSDLLKSLNNSSNQKSILKRIAEYVVNLITDNGEDILDHMYQFDATREIWAPVTLSSLHSSTQKSLKSDVFVIAHQHLLPCIQLIHSKMRINELQKRQNLENFFLTEELKQVEITDSPIELSCLHVLQQTLPFEILCQHRVGKFRIDAYIPRYRIGIQIDENNHSGYDENNERKINQALNDSNIVCIRFAPNNNISHVENGLALIKLFWSKFISIEMTCFRMINRLV